MRALGRVGGFAEGNDLTRRLGHDLEFWRKIGPSLHQGWWNDDPTPDSPLRNRYTQTLELVRVLDDIRFPGALSTSVALRDLWRSLPQLDDSIARQNSRVELIRSRITPQAQSVCRGSTALPRSDAEALLLRRCRPTLQPLVISHAVERLVWRR